jgi:hypothetical protein
MPDATTAGAGPSLIPIDLGGNRTGAVKVPADVVKYFSIPKPTAAQEEMKTINRAQYKRQVYSGLDDIVGKAVTVRAATWKAPVRAAKGNVQGKTVKIPTELKTVQGSVRFVTLHFPSTATTGAISNWIYEKCVTKKPTYFFHNGNRYSVLKAVGDVNPTPAAPAPAAPAA